MTEGGAGGSTPGEGEEEEARAEAEAGVGGPIVKRSKSVWRGRVDEMHCEPEQLRKHKIAIKSFTVPRARELAK